MRNDIYYNPANYEASEISDETLSGELTALMGRTKKFKVGIVVTTIITMIITAMCITSENYDYYEPIIQLVGFIATVAVGFCATNIKMINAKLRKLAGRTVIGGELEKVFRVISFCPNDAIKELLCHAARMRFRWDRREGSNYIYGEYRGVVFEFSNIELISVKNMGEKNEQESCVFKGQWLIVNLAREVRFRVIISSRAFGTNIPAARNGERQSVDIKTENAAFNERFVISAGDAQTAFYVLTPSVMDYIMAVDQLIGGAPIHFCFYGQQVHIVLGSRYESFVVGKDARDVPAFRARIQSEVRSLANFMDKLLQNEILFRH